MENNDTAERRYAPSRF